MKIQHEQHFRENAVVLTKIETAFLVGLKVCTLWLKTKSIWIVHIANEIIKWLKSKEEEDGKLKKVVSFGKYRFFITEILPSYIPCILTKIACYAIFVVRIKTT